MIYEVAEMLNDRKKINKDINEAIEIINNMFYEKYLKPVVNIMRDEKEKLNLEEPKEIKLLKALELFIKPEQKDFVNKIADYIILAKIFKKFELEIKNTREKNNSEHPDGIYDLDKDCISKQNNNFITRALIFALTSFLI